MKTAYTSNKHYITACSHMMYEVLIHLDKIADMTTGGPGRLVGGWVGGLIKIGSD